jgi:2,3-bisphosphoglycerate-independent phosphoglycerate mutase
VNKLVLFFIDGLGLGPDDPAVNPMRSLFEDILGGPYLTERREPFFFDRGVLIPTDAVMGVAGIPQSATGQTSLFTGINAQKHIGAHLSAYPNGELRKLIEEHSLMKTLAQRGYRTTAANLYSREFFISRRNNRRNLFPVSTLTIKASGAGFRFPDDYQAGKAVFADITNELIRRRGYAIDLIEPEQAAGRMINILRDYDFVFFEYFMTDLYGHKKDTASLTGCANVLGRFVSSLWEGIRREKAALLIVSDHGNAEDIRTGDHTTNPVPTLLLTENRADSELFAGTVSDLTDVYHAVILALDQSRAQRRPSGGPKQASR